MATVTPGYIFQNNEVVTPTKLNSAATPAISNIITADILDANVTTAKIADANVTTAKIADANVTTAKIADANVTTAKIANGAVTQEKLNSSVTLVPTGAVMPFAMNAAPSGWLAANGTEYSKTGTYASLFAVIGTTYGETNGAGGTGTTHFRVPDLRGYFVRGSGTNSDGTVSGALGAKQSQSSLTSTLSTTSQQFVTQAYNVESRGTGLNGATLTTNFATVEIRPKNIALLYCIKF